MRGGGRAFWNFRMYGGGGKISMPPVLEVWIFSGTTQSGKHLQKSEMSRKLENLKLREGGGGVGTCILESP